MYEEDADYMAKILEKRQWRADQKRENAHPQTDFKNNR